MQNPGFTGFSFGIANSSSQPPPPPLTSQPSFEAFGQRSSLPFNALSNHGTASHSSTFVQQPPAFSQSSNTFSQQSSAFQQPSNAIFGQSNAGVSFFQPAVSSFGQTRAPPAFGQTSGFNVATRQSVGSGLNGRLGGDGMNAGQSAFFGQPSSQARLGGSLFNAPTSQGFSPLRMSSNSLLGANSSRQTGIGNARSSTFSSPSRNTFFQSSVDTASQLPSTRVGQSGGVSYQQTGKLNFGQPFDESKKMIPNITLQRFVVNNEQPSQNKGSDHPPTGPGFARSNNMAKPFDIAPEGFGSSAHFGIEVSVNQETGSRQPLVASRGLGAMPFSFSKPDEHKSHHVSEASERKIADAAPDTATFRFTNPNTSNASSGGATGFTFNHPDSNSLLFGARKEEEKGTGLPLNKERFAEQNLSKTEQYSAEAFPKSDRESGPASGTLFGASKDRRFEERKRPPQGKEKSDKPPLKRTGRMAQRGGNLFSRALQDACQANKRERASKRPLDYDGRDKSRADKAEPSTSREHVEAPGTKRGARKHQGYEKLRVDEDKPLVHRHAEREVTKMRSREPKPGKKGNTKDSSLAVVLTKQQAGSVAKDVEDSVAHGSGARKFQAERMKKDSVSPRHDVAEQSKKTRMEASQRRTRRGSVKNLLIKKVSSESPPLDVASPSPSSSQLCSIVCKHVPPERNTRDAVRAWFGKVRRISCHPQKNQAIVHFEDHALASAALRKGWKVGGKEVSLYWYRRRSGSISKSPVEPTEDIEAGFRQVSAAVCQPEEASGRSEEASGVATSTHLTSREPAKTRSPSKRLEPLRDAAAAESVELPVKVSRGGAAAKEEFTTVPLAHLKGSAAGNSEEKYQLLELRDKQMRQARTRRTELEKAKAIVGTCSDMCPEKERYLREIRKQLSIYEVIPGTDKVNHAAVIKEYSRSSADQEEPLPHELRPPHVLDMTMQYLVNSVMNIGEDNWAEWYDFVWNRTRGIRKDITQQHLCEPISVSLIEKCTRFHVLCAHHLCQQPMATFEPKINNENLTKCLQSLKEMYQDLANKGIYCSGEPEFRGYSVLLNLNHGDILREVQQFREEIRNSSPVKFAVQVFSALNSNNFVRFFKLVKSASYLNACLLHRYFTQVRRDALKALNVALTVPQRSSSLPLQQMMHTLLFTSEKEAAEFFSHYGLNVTDETVELNRSSFIEPECTLAMKKSSFIECKLTTLLGEVVNGAPLGGAPRHVPSSSFDLQGQYAGDFSAEDPKDTPVFGKPAERGVPLVEDMEFTFTPAACSPKRAPATVQSAPAERAAVSLGAAAATAAAASSHKAVAPVEIAPAVLTQACAPASPEPPERASSHAPPAEQDAPDAATSFPAFSPEPQRPSELAEPPPLPGGEDGMSAQGRGSSADAVAPISALPPPQRPSVAAAAPPRVAAAVPVPPAAPAPPPAAAPPPIAVPPPAVAAAPVAAVARSPALIDEQVVESVWGELLLSVVPQLSGELAVEVMRHFSLAYGCAEGIASALTEDVTLEAVRELGSACIAEEKQKILQERLRAEVREHAALAICHELTEEVASALLSEIAATQLRLAEEQMLRERISRCGEEVSGFLLEQVMAEEVSELVTQLQQGARERARSLALAAAAVSLSRTRQYFHRWSTRLAARKRLRRSMLTFPAAPAYCASAFHHSHFPQAEREDGTEPRDHIDTSSLFSLRKQVAHQINVQSIYRKLLGEAVWAPLDLAQLLVSSVPSPQPALYWKLLLLLPPSRARSKQDRLLCRWLKIKFQRGNVDTNHRAAGTEEEIEEEESLKTLSLYTVRCPPGSTSASSFDAANGEDSMNLEQEDRGSSLRNAVPAHVCVRLMERTLSATEAKRAEESRALLGTSAVLLLLPEPEAGRGLHRGVGAPSMTAPAWPCATPEEEYWESGRLQLAQALEGGPRWPPTPVAVLVPHSARMLDTRQVEHGLSLKELVANRRISDYRVVHMAEDATFLQSNQTLKEAVRWLASRCPAPPPLCCDSVRGFLEEGVCREFGSRFYPDQAARRRAQAGPQSPQAIVELYNGVIRHLAAVACSASLAALSWPPAEFSRGSRAEALPPHLGWNSPRHLRWLEAVLMGFQLPPPPQEADWSTVDDALEKYVPRVASVESRPVLLSNLARILKRAGMERDANRGACGGGEDEDEEEEEEERRLGVRCAVPWDELLDCCVGHKLSECFLEMEHVSPDALSEEGDALVYYLERDLHSYRPPAAWEEAQAATLRAARSQQDADVGQRRRRRRPVHFAVVDGAAELLPESLTAELQEALQLEREDNASFERQLSAWLCGPPEMSASSLTCTPAKAKLLPQENWEVDLDEPQEEVGGEAWWVRDPSESLSRGISRLRRQIRAGNEADRCYERYLRSLLEADT
ncbi:germinal-center associated nuclear protein isoform X2 [Petromyzon marinus]|uniref:germinal-center associated nuclear protein isoform X2 n=1 Tax=Petromyzon marinus TaxID=7757 RepID=UPI003F72840E